MNKKTGLFAGMAAGAGLLYFLDPNRGRRRRAFVRDKARSLSAQSGGALRKVGRDLSNRVSDAAAGARSLLRGDHDPVDDQMLEARVRSEMDHNASHPGALEATAGDVPALQASGPQPTEKPPLSPASWTPALCAIGAASGSLLAILSLSKGHIVGTAAGLVGVGLATRAMNNLKATGSSRKAVDARSVRKQIGKTAQES